MALSVPGAARRLHQVSVRAYVAQESWNAAGFCRKKALAPKKLKRSNDPHIKAHHLISTLKNPTLWCLQFYVQFVPFASDGPLQHIRHWTGEYIMIEHQVYYSYCVVAQRSLLMIWESGFAHQCMESLWRSKGLRERSNLYTVQTSCVAPKQGHNLVLGSTAKKHTNHSPKVEFPSSACTLCECVNGLSDVHAGYRMLSCLFGRFTWFGALSQHHCTLSTKVIYARL